MEEDKEIENLSKNLKKIRKAKHISQYKLAEKAGVDLNTIKNIEQQTANPVFKTLIPIANALDCNVKDLVDVEPKVFLSPRKIVLDEKTIKKLIADAATNLSNLILKEMLKL